MSLVALLAVVSCQTWDEDFNIDPNAPIINAEKAVHPKYLMGSMIDGVQRYHGAAFSIMSSVTMQTSRLYSVSQAYRHRAWHDLDGNIWGPTYTTIQHAKFMRAAAKSIGDVNYEAVADIWECYVLYVMTMCDGAIPYFNVIEDTDKFTVPYDPQDQVYKAILAKLKTASDLIANPEGKIDASFDYVYGGNMLKWKKLANHLRLRMAIHMSDVDANASKVIFSEILSDANKYPIFESNDDNFVIHFDGVGRRSPWSGQKEIDDAAISCILAERLISLKDPRLPEYARPPLKLHDDPVNYILATNPGEDKYVGGMVCIARSSSAPGNWNENKQYISRLSENFVIVDEQYKQTEASASIPWVKGTYSELNFILAEAAYKGLIDGGSNAAKDYYEEGIKSSFQMYNCQFGSSKYIGAYADEGLASEMSYLNQPDVDWNGGRDQMLLICEQRWMATFCLDFEPYFNYRRTMLPMFPASTVADENYGYQGSGTKFPSRTAYPQSEFSENKLEVENAWATMFSEPITGDDNRNEVYMWLLSTKSSDFLQMKKVTEPLKYDEYPGHDGFPSWYAAHYNSLFYWLDE